jgi:hypothetical protein
MKHRKLTWGLALVVIVVWGSIAYQVYSSLLTKPDGNEAPVLEAKVRNGGKRISYTYTCDVRDPFKYIAANARDSHKKEMASAGESNWGPPPLRLTGILSNASTRTAILERNDGAVFFVHEGDTLEGLKVLRVRDREVRYSYRKRNAEWVIQE